MRCNEKRRLEDDICDIKQCLVELEKGLNDICIGSICKGEIVCEVALDEIEDALDDLLDIIHFNDNEICKRENCN